MSRPVDGGGGTDAGSGGGPDNAGNELKEYRDCPGLEYNERGGYAAAIQSVPAFAASNSCNEGMRSSLFCAVLIRSANYEGA